MKTPKCRLRPATFLALSLLAVTLTACGGVAAPAEEEEAAEEEELAEEEEAMEEPMEEEEAVEEEAAEEEAAFAEEEVLVAGEPPDVASLEAEQQLAEAASQPVRLVIKDGFMRLHVADINAALDEIGGIAARHGGYVLSSENNEGTRARNAEITITVRSEDFESALAELRTIAIRVLDESVEGQDVTTEYVDLQARLTNLEATAERLRGFLDDAQNVDEALEINEELASIEGQIEEVRGRINYLETRAALSTITVSLLTDPRPTATPTITPTPTSTPTSTPTPTATATSTPTLTPTATPWVPGVAVGDAANTEMHVLRQMLHGLVNLFIVVGIIVVPTLLPFVGLFFVGRGVYRRWQQRQRVASGAGDAPEGDSGD